MWIECEDGSLVNLANVETVSASRFSNNTNRAYITATGTSPESSYRIATYDSEDEAREALRAIRDALSVRAEFEDPADNYPLERVISALYLLPEKARG